MEKFEFRAYIKTRSLLGTPATEIFNELVVVWGDNAPSYPTVAKWAARFKAGWEALKDDPHSCRPITVVNISWSSKLSTKIHATIDAEKGKTITVQY